jgi:hypothetical protein
VQAGGELRHDRGVGLKADAGLGTNWLGARYAMQLQCKPTHHDISKLVFTVPDRALDR